MPIVTGPRPLSTHGGHQYSGNERRGAKDEAIEPYRDPRNRHRALPGGALGLSAVPAEDRPDDRGDDDGGRDRDDLEHAGHGDGRPRRAADRAVLRLAQARAVINSSRAPTSPG